MSKPMPRDETIRNGFLATVKKQGGTVISLSEVANAVKDSTVRDIILELGRRQREIYLVRGVGLINIHVRSEPPGWWSIVKAVKEDLDFLTRELNVRVFYILLIGRNDSHIANGYIATDFLSKPFIKSPGVHEVVKYSINENSHLDKRWKIRSIDETANTLLTRHTVT